MTPLPPPSVLSYCCLSGAAHRIDPQFLKCTKPDAEFDTDEAPLIVFINARSGGRVGPQLAGVLARAVGSAQVCMLAACAPGSRVTRGLDLAVMASHSGAAWQLGPAGSSASFDNDAWRRVPLAAGV